MVALRNLHPEYQNVEIELVEPLMPVITEVTVDLTGPDCCMEVEQLLREKEAAGLVLQAKQSYLYFLSYRGSAVWRGNFVFTPGKPRKPGLLTVDFFEPEDGDPTPAEKKAALVKRHTRWDGLRFHILVSRTTAETAEATIEG